jgi:hypothetical protein
MLCNHLLLVMMIFFYFENLLVETGMLISVCLLVQFCTGAAGSGLPVSTVGVTIAT